ncbi:histidine--tRNA ligase [Sphingorhabdus lacus]|uniref:Histidine--tRNA ligase n=1 Tax=Sphingorhabdus lacus TaxID=392610 RepID=A0A6I6L576_9SPHN|nr:histidine--tRNA ligase [Sphingorhabdus lacus]QGY80919.1 histidine--tRNA ligase [Sphingorhabdus lacus]
MAKIQTPQPVRGTQDMFGETEERFAHVVATFERVRRLYGFKGLQLPVIEPTAVFSRSLGEATDVVSKEMYSFEDRGGDSITLRPEFTAGIARAYLTNGWQQYAPMKLSVHGPLFRYERPQKGRYRQFHQIDAEIIGAAEPAADVELLVMADQLLKELGIDDGVTLQLNTLGDTPSRDAWRAALVSYFNDHRDVLSEDSLARLEKNPLRILDSKDPDDRGIAYAAPKIDDFLSAEASDFFAAVTAGLDAAGVAWTRNAALVRGLDYYRHTAFEFVTDRLGAQGTVLGGGRYDGLIENLGGPATPAVGWAAGIERLAMLVEQPVLDKLGPAVILSGQEAASAAVKLVAAIRRESINAELIYKGSVNKLFDKLKAKGYPIILTVAQKENAIFLNLRRLSNDIYSIDLEEKLMQVFRSKLKADDADADDHGIRPNFRIALIDT